MGYTVYAAQPAKISKKTFDAISKDIQKINKVIETAFNVTLCNGMGEPDTNPAYNDKIIAFNGSGDESHETFIIYRNYPVQVWQNKKSKTFGLFTKTARKPYDLAVKCGYLIMKHYLNTPISWDGPISDIYLASGLIEQVLGYKVDLNEVEPLIK